MHSGGKIIAKNTLMLYIRLLVNMGISLYTSRVVLQVLGIEDYGIFSVVSGVLVLFSFLNSSMSGATSRYLTYDIGIGDVNGLKRTFSSSVIIHILIALLIAILAETIGIWFINNKLVIPSDKLISAHWIFQFAILSMIITVTQVPYNSLILSYEKMNIYAYIEILNSILKLGAVYLLYIDFLASNKLILYAVLNFIMTLIIGIIYRGYCIQNFKECKIEWVWEKKTIKKLISFSGWDMYGNISVVARTQGINMLLNIFFGPIMNAASDIATKVQGIVMNFSTNISIASRPQIVKEYSIDNHERMINLIRDTSRITFILMMMVSVPLMVKINFILNIWLTTVPKHTETLCVLTLLWNLVVSMTIANNHGVQATAKIKVVSLVAGTLFLLVVPITYLCFKAGLPFWIPFALNVVSVIISPFVSGFTLRKTITGYSIRKILIPDLLRDWFALTLTLTIVYVGNKYIHEGWLSFFIAIILSILVSVLCGYFIIYPKKRRYIINNFVYENIICKIRH